MSRLRRVVSVVEGLFGTLGKLLPWPGKRERGLSIGDGTGVRLDCTPELNSRWQASERGYRITVRGEALISAKTRVLTIGSCFAVELRKALRARDVNVYPKYFDIELESEREIIAMLPRRDNVNHYDTFAIRQEFQRALAPPEDARRLFRPLPVKAGSARTAAGAAIGYQDPYRKNVLAVDEDGIEKASDKVDECFRRAVQLADVFVITLGLVEAWQDAESGLFVWSEKVRRLSPNPERIRFRRTGYQQNYENLRWVCQAIKERFPEKRVVLTVSPVALKRTFTDEDIVVANTYSKAVLRAVAGQVADDLDNVVYWPSYELSLKMNLFTGDGRHVSEEGVDFIVSNFLRAHSTL